MATAGAAQTPAARERLAAGPRVAWTREPAVLFLAAAIFAAAAVILHYTRGITFLLDEWEFLLYRPGFNAHAVLDPHNEHISIIPVLVYKALLEVFGMDSARPFQVASTATFLASAALLFVWLRGRVGEWAALAGAILILFLGAAWEDLLWAFQIGYFGSMAAGLGALIALRREDARGDLLACGLLTVALAFSSLGIPFVVGAAIAIATAPDWRRRAYPVAVPVALFALWWIGWGRTAENHASLSNLAGAPLYVFDSIGAALASLVGLATPRSGASITALDWGRPLAALALVGVGLRLHRLGRVPRWLWVVGAIALSYWVLTAFNLAPGRDATASRYQYVGAIFVLLIAAELVRGVRIGLPAIVLTGAVICFAVLSNLAYLRQSADSYEKTSALIEADLGAVEIARDTVAPGFVLTNSIAGTPYVHVAAGAYLPAAGEFGSPADTPAEIAAAPDDAREAADRVLASALGLRVSAGATPAAGSTCRRLVAGAEGETLSVGPGELTVAGSPSTHAELRLRRFAASSFPVGAGEVADETVGIAIPPDRSTVPWQLQLTGRGPVEVCYPPAGQ